MSRYLVTIVSLSIIIFSVFAAPADKDSSGMSPFAKEQIVPDVIDNAPNTTVEVKYSDDLLVNNGNELTPVQVKKAPLNVSWPADESSLYTLSMVDPDAPSRADPKLREINHWLVVNIKGNNVTTGDTITPYTGSRPPKDSGLHRYIFLVFKQSAPLQLAQSVASDLRENRARFSIRKFSKDNNLGDAVAGNFYQAKFTEQLNSSTNKP